MSSEIEIDPVEIFRYKVEQYVNSGLARRDLHLLQQQVFPYIPELYQPDRTPSHQRMWRTELNGGDFGRHGRTTIEASFFVLRVLGDSTTLEGSLPKHQLSNSYSKN